MALPVNGSTHLIPAYYSIYRPRKDERLSWPSWLTCSGWLTHISGQPSAAGRAQDRESSPVRDRRSTTVPRPACSLLLSCTITDARFSSKVTVVATCCQLSSTEVSKSVSNKCIAVRKVATPLREHTCHMGSHSVTCHPAEVTFPPLPQPKLVLD